MSAVISSQQVAWWDVHLWVQRYLDAAGAYPAAGTPEWVALADSDRRKWAAVLDAGQHHVLRVETAQVAMADASKVIAGAADWPAVSRELRQRNEFYTQRPWLRRAAS